MENREERIRRRAYEIWEREGRTGDPEDHWHRAERELAGSTEGGADATVDLAPPTAAVEAMEAIEGKDGSEGAASPKEAPSRKPRRKRA